MLVQTGRDGARGSEGWERENYGGRRYTPLRVRKNCYSFAKEEADDDGG